MNDQTDAQLLRAYAEHRSEPAFAELVRRHVDIVHSAALRMVCDSHLAQDVTQGVFVALASNAAQLTDRPVLSGWLHRTAQNIAAQTVRTDVRRRVREQEAAAMNELLAAEPDALWEHIAPHLDAALGELSEADRDAVLLRYFERKSASEMAHNARHQRRRRAKAREPRRGTPARILRQTRRHRRRERTRRRHFRQRRPSRAGWIGRHHFNRCRTGRNNHRRHRNCNRNQNHRHDHTAKNLRCRHDRCPRWRGNLRSPSSFICSEARFKLSSNSKRR